MAAIIPPRILIATIRYENGSLSFFVGDVPCWSVERSFDLAGPWHHLVDGAGTTPVNIADPSSSGPTYYRVVERPCRDREYSAP